MANDSETYSLNYFFRDYVSDDILSYGIGEVWLYHYKESIFGVRDIRHKKSYFVDINSIKDYASNFCPTLTQLTESHIKEAYEECDHGGEETERLPLPELILKAKEVVMGELAKLFDDAISSSAAAE